MIIVSKLSVCWGQYVGKFSSSTPLVLISNYSLN